MKLCSRCDVPMVADTSIVFTSNPPQYLYECPRCGKKEYGLCSDNLEDEATKYAQDKYLPVQTAQSFKAGAQWQKQQDQSTIELAEDHAYLAGQEKIIDKAIKWLEDNIDRYLYNTGGYEEYIPKCGGKMFEDFKKAMEE